MNNAIEHFIASKPKKYQPVLYALHNLISDAAPFYEEIKWKVPMYSYKGIVCFVNLHQNKKPIIAFTKGYLLSNQNGILTATDRKYIRHLEVLSLEDFYRKEAMIIEVLQEAILLNEKHPNTNWKKL